MKKWGKFFLPALLAITSQAAHGQLKGFGLGPYVEMAWPTGDFQQTHKNGIGAGLMADIKLPGKIGLTGSIGYQHFGGKMVFTGEGNEDISALNAFPVRVGLKYRPVPLIYIKMETGSAQFTSGNGAAFILSPGIGIRVLGLDVQAKYETWFREGSRSFWGVRAGLNW